MSYLFTEWDRLPCRSFVGIWPILGNVCGFYVSLKQRGTERERGEIQPKILMLCSGTPFATHFAAEHEAFYVP